MYNFSYGYFALVPPKCEQTDFRPTSDNCSSLRKFLKFRAETLVEFSANPEFFTVSNLPIKSKEGQKYREKQTCLYVNVGTNAKNVMISFLASCVLLSLQEMRQQ